MAGLLARLAASEFERLRSNWERVAAQNAAIEANTVNGMGQLVGTHTFVSAPAPDAARRGYAMG